MSTETISLDNLAIKTASGQTVKLSRAARRAMQKQLRKPGRVVQKHRTAAQIISDVGLVPFAAVVPVTDDEFQKIDSALFIRYQECRAGRGDSDMWAYLMTTILEGWCIASYIDLENKDYFRRTLKAAARAWDAAVLHLNKEGEVLLANMDVVLEALQLVTDLHRALRRDELLAIMKRSQTTADDLVKALFDGDLPKSGYIPGKLYEEPK